MASVLRDGEDRWVVPSADNLYERLVALLSPVSDDEDLSVLSRDQLLAGTYDPAVVDRPFIVRVANEGESAEARITRWLATPNPSLAGERPGDLLRGNARGRCRLEYMIAEMKQGAFS